MNITFGIDGEDIILDISISTIFADDRTITFHHNSGDDGYASIIAEKMQRELDKHIEAVRKDAYEEGRKDAKRKSTKRTYFDYSFYVKKMGIFK